MHDLANVRTHRLVQQQGRAVDVDGAQQVLVPRQWHLRDVVEDDVAAGDGPRHGVSVPDVAADQFDVGCPVVRVVQVQHPDVMPGPHQSLDEQRPEVSAAAGDETGGPASLLRVHSCIPCRTHH